MAPVHQNGPMLDWVTVESDNGLLSVQHQSISWTNDAFVNWTLGQKPHWNFNLNNKNDKKNQENTANYQPFCFRPYFIQCLQNYIGTSAFADASYSMADVEAKFFCIKIYLTPYKMLLLAYVAE